MSAAEPWPPFRVLCVDDNRDCADSTVLLLRSTGLMARACYDGHTALRLTEEFRPSVCLLDLNMPGMDGDEVALRMRDQPWCPLLLVALTAMSNEASCRRIAAAGFHLHLVKPVDPQKLIGVVDGLFQRAESASHPVREGDEPIGCRALVDE